jgi:pyrimidine-nucleoside phosphorylase
MSKKLAEGLTGLVLDVKQGSGAFMPDTETASELARAMIRLGDDRGCRVVALLTAMDRPLGRACGNALEMVESIEALMGNGRDDLMEVTYALGAEMLILAGKAVTHAEAWRAMKESIRSGRALAKFIEIVEAQGGDPRIVEDPSIFAQATTRADFIAGRDGFVTGITPRTIGYGIIALGGGRTSMEDEIDPSVGFVIHARVGAEVRRGDRLATIHASDAAGIREGHSVLAEAITIADIPATALPLVATRISADGIEEWHRPE